MLSTQNRVQSLFKKAFYAGLVLSVIIPNFAQAEEAVLQIQPSEHNRPTIHAETPAVKTPEVSVKPRDPSAKFMNPVVLTIATPEVKPKGDGNTTTTPNDQPKPANGRTILPIPNPIPVPTPLPVPYETQVIDLNGKRVAVNLTQLANSVKQAALDARMKSGVFCIEGCGDPNDLMLLPGVKDLFTREELNQFEMNPILRTAATKTDKKTASETNGLFPFTFVWYSNAGPTYTEKGWKDFSLELIRRLDKAGAEILTKIYTVPLNIVKPMTVNTSTSAVQALPTNNLTTTSRLYQYRVDIAKVMVYLRAGLFKKVVAPDPIPVPYPGPILQTK